ncbi:4-galactosyl-N-acetylglucosaminide 3-alpha-L-fucosyltransferase 9-like [Syngnathoides biaculeatus]|uniref:4-galactosyl-N-acetylglucosaminide 3-alpha-L-fucosyltransferase 9-like n=1 Tax=Syngnathoides biaculeatus TaxID=300417 RepID=UPI002ADE8DB1|nr:4-galactosyl-N-acetylglucosaminide 3-alpha-L-fucosyltransferase 9-like [Syngnathoides biaculeatus]XP_061699886.1 4-galactosyl-N-acetylglucosaminide 3-alpha-L-fucosyltransferase 9-like [Syngnathoides biaculeatus]
MSSEPVHRNLRLLLLGTFFLAFFAILYFMYFKSSTGWLSDPVHAIFPIGHVKDLFTKSNRSVTTVLAWVWRFEKRNNLNVCASQFNIDGCFITADRNLYNKSDGVVIRHRDIVSNLSNLPPIQRPSFQKWVWLNLESPAHIPHLDAVENLFNLTLSYRRDADILVPFGSIVSNEGEDNFVLLSKNKLLCWIVSNWKQNFARVKYYNELQKHIKVHGYGRAFNKSVDKQEYVSILTSCKFYLAFENSIQKDYITEKFYNPLGVGTVPVVLGPSRDDYEKAIQGDAFIHVEDFASPKELADYLLFLDKNEDMYLKYFKWRRHFKVKKTQFWTEHMCLACDYLRRHRESQVVENLNKWFWS